MKMLLSVSFLLSTLGAVRAEACSCIPPQPPKESLAKADAALSGKVLALEKVANPNGTLPRVAVVIQVDRIWKGAKDAQARVLTSVGGATCGYSFQVGGDYLVYAHRDPKGTLWTSLCSRTRPLRQAGEDLQALGAGEPPMTMPPIPEPTSTKIVWGCNEPSACTAVVGPYRLGTGTLAGQTYVQRDPRAQSTCCQLSEGIKTQICNDNGDPRGVEVSCY